MTATDPVRRSVLSAGDVGLLQAWAAEVQAWPAGSHIWGHYAERTADGTAICRTENVSACHIGVRDLVEGPLRDLAAAAVGAEVTDFKDKLNYKQPGGAGFSPHQDLLAYPGVNRVLSVLVAIDECTAESGCLWLAGGVDGPLPVDDRGVVQAEVADALTWTPAPLAPGDAVCLDGLTPHYSEANSSARPRRVLVASYAPTAAGYGRDRYYAARGAAMQDASARDGRSRISTLADFQGDEVAPAEVAVGTCAHP